MKKYLITGGAGFIGSHLAELLSSKGHEIVIVDDLSSGLEGNVPAGARFIRADVRDRGATESLFEKERPDGAFHMAAIVSVQYSLEHPEEARAVNVDGTRNVAEAARKTGAKLVFSSSSAVYGDQPPGSVREDAPLHPKSPYGEHKRDGEAFADVSLRYFNVYGPRQRGDSAYAGVIARFLKFKKEGKPLVVFGDGLQTRDFIYVSDVARANLAAMEKGRKGSVYNIGSGIAASIMDIARIFGGEIRHEAPRVEPRDSLADIGKAKAELSWHPEIALEEGIARLIKG